MIDTVILTTEDPQAVDRAVEVLKQDGLVAFPTDTVYGLAAGVRSHPGIHRLYEAKERSAGKAIAVLIGDEAQLAELTAGLTESARRLAARFWPGALTLVIPRRPDLPEILSPLPTVGVRMPDHAFARALLRAAGPLATSSANISGEASPTDARQVIDHLAGKVELIIDGGPAPGGVPSTVVDCTQEPPRILRLGAISETEILSAL